MSLRRTCALACALTLGFLAQTAPASADRGGSPAKTPTTTSTTAPPAPSSPNAPSNLRITASTSTSVSLAWDAVKYNKTFWYCVQNGGTGCIRVDPPQTSLTRSPLLPDRTFSWSVYAIDQAGNRSASSNVVTFTTPPDTTPPSPPPTLSTTSVYPTRVNFAWTASVDNISQVFYDVFINGSPMSGEFMGFGTGIILRATPTTTYEIRVVARDASGNTAESNLLSVTTPPVTETVAPTAPTNLRFEPETSPPEAWLAWDPSTDNADAQSLILYDVYLNGVRNNDGIIGGTETVTYCRGSGLTEIVLRAVDTSGNVSGPSNALLFDCG